MHHIEVDPNRQLVSVRLRGMMSPDDVVAYIADLKLAFVRNRLRTYVMIVDVTDCPIQSQDMMRAMGEHMTSMPKARALAIVTGSSLARMQVRRLFTQRYARLVATPEEARAWVLHGLEPARAVA